MAELSVVHPDGTTQTATIEQPGLDDYYRLIGCDMIEVITLADGREMIIDEEGKLKDVSANPTATKAAEGVLLNGDWIAGVAVIQPGGTLE